MKKSLCKRSGRGFKKGNYYNVVGIHTVFEQDDFITISDDNRDLQRFVLKSGIGEVEDYISQAEILFTDYFYSPEETINIDRTELIDRILK